jgi:hypothetical protein
MRAIEILSPGNSIIGTLYIIVMIILSAVIVQAAWVGIERLAKWKRNPKPKLEHYFTMPNQNDLRLRIHNRNRSKEVYVELWQKDFLTIRGKQYIHEYPNELRIVRDSRGNGFPLYRGTLAPNDTIEIKVGIPHNEKIALRILGDDSPIFKFRDGRFEYVVSGKGKYLGNAYTLPDFSVWLTIKDGVLVKIDKNL